MKELKPKFPDFVDRISIVNAVKENNLPLIDPLPPLAELVRLKYEKPHELSYILLYYLLTYGGEIEKLSFLIKDKKIKILLSMISKMIKFVAKKFYKH